MGGQGGKSENFIKGGGSVLQGKVFLKGGRAGTFLIPFFQGLSFLHLEITLLFLKLCYTLEEKKNFLPP